MKRIVIGVVVVGVFAVGFGVWWFLIRDDAPPEAALVDRDVAEDGGDMQVVGLAPDGSAFVLLQLVGQDGSELTGPAFSPDGTRLYLSSQRGPVAGGNHGITYEVRGAFAGVAATIFADGYE